MADFVPRADKDLIDWLNVFYPYLNTNVTALGLAPADATALDTQKLAMETAYSRSILFV